MTEMEAKHNLPAKQHSSTNQTEYVSLLTAASILGINVFTSSSLMQSKVVRNQLPAAPLKNLAANSARHLLLLRSLPNDSIVCNLVGMKAKNHIQDNLGVLSVGNLSAQEYMAFNNSLKSSSHHQGH